MDVFSQEISVNEAKMHSFCHVFARSLRGNETILLFGTLGMGKTSFAREVIRALCGEETEVVSPTFMLMQEYGVKAGFPIHHYDLYRIEHEAELAELGMEETLGRVLTLVEWPEIALSYFPEERIEVHFSQTEGHSRRLQVIASGGMVSAIKDIFAALDEG